MNRIIFFFNDTATTEIYTLSLHDALPIFLSVVDCFDALTSDRPYRRRMTEEAALDIIVERRGRMYDPVVVDAFLVSYRRVMPPTDSARHPAARAIGDALSMDRD